MTNNPTCDWCGNSHDIRVETERYRKAKPSLTCRDCFTPSDTGPDFDDLEAAGEEEL